MLREVDRAMARCCKEPKVRLMNTRLAATVRKEPITGMRVLFKA